MRNIRIGDYLVSKGLITEEQLIKVLQVQKESQGTKRFGEIIIELGILSEVKFAQALASKLKVPFVDLSNMEIDEEAAKKIPEALAKKHTVIGINVQGKRLTVATDDPINFNILEDIKVSTGMDTIPVLATKTAINKAIGKTYQKQKVDSVIEDVAQHSVEEKVDEGAKERIESAPIVKLATTIVENGFRADATDIHIEPFKKYTRIRVRVNGDLIELMNVSNVVHNSLATRLKLISGMNIAEKRLPQDGRFTQVVDGVTLDVRVSSLPTVNGEKIVIRILSNGSISLRKITDLGMTDYNYGMFEKMLKCPHGVILVTGPTGSGKSTTLAAMIDYVNIHKSAHIITVEDPIEYMHEHKRCMVNQREVGMDVPDFASALRAALREDPDVILVGEMRDFETISAAVTAAETGHLVFSTLHTTSASDTINRIIDVYPEHQQQQIRAQLANVLVAVISQTLVPTADGKGRIAAQEILNVTDACSAMIRDNKVHLIQSAIQTGRQNGMQCLDQELARLTKKGIINEEHALEKCHDKQEFYRFLNAR